MPEAQHPHERRVQRVARRGIRTRKLAEKISEKVNGKAAAKKRAAKILEKCGIKPRGEDDARSDMLVYTTQEAIVQMAKLLQNGDGKNDEELAEEFGKLISESTSVPDMALSGRMLETGVLKDTTVEAALQVAHAISTHEARPEVDYFVAADDVPGDDAGAGSVGEAMFAAACFYKYFSIDFETLTRTSRATRNLPPIRWVRSFVAPPCPIPPASRTASPRTIPPMECWWKSRNNPLSYANAFARPVELKASEISFPRASRSSASTSTISTPDTASPTARFWFSPNLRYPLNVAEEKPGDRCG